MTNMFYVIFVALVMLLWISNLSVSYDIISTGYTALWSDTIPKWNVQLLVGTQSHLFLFQHICLVKLEYQNASCQSLNYAFTHSNQPICPVVVIIQRDLPLSSLYPSC